MAKFTLHIVLSKGVPQRIENDLLVDATGEKAATIFDDYDHARNAIRRTNRRKPGREFNRVRCEWQE